MRKFAFFFFGSLIIFGRNYMPRLPRRRNHATQEYRSATSHMERVWSLDAAQRRRACRDCAALYIADLRPDYGLSGSRRRKRLPGEGIPERAQWRHHLIFRQQYDGIDVHGSEFTVNIDAAGQIINAGGRLYREARRPRLRPSRPAR